MCAVEKIIEIPGSVRFFFSDNNRTRLLEFDKSSVPPPPFEFAEVLQFYQAKRNVTFCKMDLFQFMGDVFQKVWLPALEGAFSPQKVKDLGLEGVGELFNPDSVWGSKYHALYWYFTSNTFGNVQLCVGCYLANIDGVFKICICVYLYNVVEGGGLEGVEDLKLDEFWVQNDADKTEYSLDKTLCPSLGGKDPLDISVLVEKAGQAVQAIREYLESHRDKS
ncbi:hypothetical protein LI168_00075 [Desulfovibrio desulfuricans]|uniref:hypothetical protein n=1 Tax=Desulfovibrio desulfuricans TaxID=876 RepID=UPI001D07A2CB|nr:hypothetical protein [Desulfovibrio desulfuricans]MCB6540538.1 hypothetical protein [Desulfovibrio desulfuricans]MCB6551620.1 hypothetical protein [Desulfovibrio desulfuricans]MCB6563463.1 hypothetical protein [Desulfovibrio desulfuricans]MCB7344948.1 hypothetical protein [Desulfovibrio desulfuricans]MCQ5216561.1 hypothetical protein [Desulfovibrio desulfuricans]